MQRRSENSFLKWPFTFIQVKLYDHRLLQRGAVQSYEGHVNSHTRIHLGVDPAERFVMSGECYFSDVILVLFNHKCLRILIETIPGGQDCNLRLWSIKSGELLFEDKFTNRVLSTVCYQTCRNSKNGTPFSLSLNSRIRYVFGPLSFIRVLVGPPRSSSNVGNVALIFSKRL